MCAQMPSYLSTCFLSLFFQPATFPLPPPPSLPSQIRSTEFILHTCIGVAAKRAAKTGQTKHPGSARPSFEPRTTHISIFSSYPEAPQLCYLSSLVARFNWARRFRRTAGRALRAGMAEDVRRWCIWRCRVVNWSLVIVLSRGYEHSFGQLVQPF